MAVERLARSLRVGPPLEGDVRAELAWVLERRVIQSLGIYLAINPGPATLASADLWTDFLRTQGPFRRLCLEGASGAYRAPAITPVAPQLEGSTLPLALALALPLPLSLPLPLPLTRAQMEVAA